VKEVVGNAEICCLYELTEVQGLQSNCRSYNLRVLPFEGAINQFHISVPRAAKAK